MSYVIAATDMLAAAAADMAGIKDPLPATGSRPERVLR